METESEAPEAVETSQTNNHQQETTTTSECLNDPNFATICSFIEKFGELCQLGPVPFQDLQDMIENTNEVLPPLVDLHMRLLRRVYKSVSANRWEKQLCKFAHTFSYSDGWELEQCGYKKTRIQTKLRVLKNLLESQFDFNAKFKGEVNKLEASALRLMPLGRDVEGHAYWYQVDPEANLRVYREDAEEETWDIVASNREEMETLIGQLKRGEIRKLSNEDNDAANLEENGFDESPEELAQGTPNGYHPKDEEAKDDIPAEGVTVAVNGFAEPGESKVLLIDSEFHTEEPNSTDIMQVIKDHGNQVPAAEQAEAGEGIMKKELRSENGVELSEPEVHVNIIHHASVVPNDVSNNDVVEDIDKVELTDTHSLGIGDDEDEEPMDVTESQQAAVVKTEEKLPNTVGVEVLEEPDDMDINASGKEKSLVEDIKEVPAVPVVTKNERKLASQDLARTEDSAMVQVQVPKCETLDLKVEPMEVKKSVEVEKVTLETRKTVVDIKQETAEEVNAVTLDSKAAAAVLKIKEASAKDIPEVKEEPVDVTITELGAAQQKQDSENLGETTATTTMPIVELPDFEEEKQKAPVVVDQSEVSERTDGIVAETVKGLPPAVDITEAVELSPGATVPGAVATERMQGATDTAMEGPDDKNSDSASVKLLPKVLDAGQPTLDGPLIVSGDVCARDLSKTSIAAIPEPREGTTVGSSTSSEVVTSGGVTTTCSRDLEGTATKKVSETRIIELPDDTAEASADNEKVTESTTEESATVQSVEEPLEPLEAPDAAVGPPITEQLTKTFKPPLSSPISSPTKSKEVNESPVMTDGKQAVVSGNVEPPKSSNVPETSNNNSVSSNFGSGSHKQLVKEAEHDGKPEGTSGGDSDSGNSNKTEETEKSASSPSEKAETHKKTEASNSTKPEVRAASNSTTVESSTKKPEAIEQPSIKENAYVCGAMSANDDDPVKTSPLNPEVRHEESTPSKGNRPSSGSQVDEPRCVKSHAYVCGNSDNCEPSKSLVDAVSAEVIPNDSGHTVVPSVSSDPRAVGAGNSDSSPAATKNSSRPESVPDSKVSPSREAATESLLETSSVDTKQKVPVPSPKAVHIEASQSSKPKIGLVEYADSSDEEAESSYEPEVLDRAEGGTKRKLEANEDAVKPSEKIPKIDNAPSGIPIVGEAIEEPLMVISGQGEGKLNEGGNDDLGTEDSSQEAGHLPPAKGKGRGRPKKGTSNGTATPATPRGRKKSVDDTYKVGRGAPPAEESSGPTRRSSRVAQIREKEEEQRRKLEEERLAQLKEAQVRKQQKQLEQKKTPKKTPQKSESGNYIEYNPEDDTESHDEDDDDEDEVTFGKKGKKGRKHGRKSKNGKPLKKGATPWMEGSSEDGSAEEEEEHYDEVEDDEEELVFNGSDHEFSPESDLDDDAEISPSRHARTARQKEEAVDKYSETNCNKCKKGDHPEWILLCDACDKGWHASCLNPQLWVIPEGQWFCPPCEHIMLVKKLDDSLVGYEKIWQRRENEILEKQRLAYINISLSNVLPEKEEAEDEEEPEPRPRKSASRKRRMVYSDDEEVRGFVDDRSDASESGSNGSGSYESEDEPLYKLRARRATKTFNFKEYDDMIKSALKDSDAEEEAYVEEHVNGTSEAPELTTEENPEKVVENEGEVEPKPEGGPAEDETDEEELDEKEKNKRKLFKSGARKVKKRLNDLSATSEEDSDEDFKESEEEDEDEEENAAEEESDWSGGGDSDDSMAKTLKRRKQQSHHRKSYGRREAYVEGESVRRSTRRNRGRAVKYDESDQEDDEGGSEKWKSEESGGSESFPSGTESEEDETWGKKKKKPAPPPKPGNFFARLGAIGKSSKPKKKRRKSDADEVDRSWSRKIGNKNKKSPEDPEPQERKTRGRQINFKDILDSGESDDDGNIKPKRRRILSDSEEDYREDSPSSSRKLAEEIKAENKRIEAEELERLRKEKEAQAIAAAESAKAREKKSKITEPKPAKPPTQSTVPVLGHSIASMAESSTKNSKGSNSIVENMLGSSALMQDPLSIMSAQVSGIPTAVPVPNPDQVSLTSALNPAYLPTVIPAATPPVTTGSVGTGSARVGKRKSATGSEVLAFPSSKKPGSSSPASSPPTSKPGALPPSGMPGLPPPGMPGMPSELHRLGAPMYGGNPGLTPFHPAWARGPYEGPAPGASMGKPPPGGFGPQQSPLRPTAYGQPPPGMRVPPPNPMGPFQHFGKDPTGAYKMPSQHQLPRGVLPPMVREPFLGHPAYPYGMLPPHPQSHPPHPSLFGHFEYRPPAPDTFTKAEPIDRQSIPPSTSSSAPSPVPPVSITSTKKDDAPTGQGGGEFGGLVSYFSSQHADDD